MTRIFARLCLLFASVALVLAAAPQIAAAQDDGADADDNAVVEADADADAESDTAEHLMYDPDSNAGAFVVPDVQVSDSDAATTGGTGGGNASGSLAVTGSEAEPVAAISIGLLALGGAVLVTSRRRLSLFR